MSNTIGLDLGTNSIGWAIRNPYALGNQIEKFGVLTFNKGVGLGKTGEYSYAAERTKKRSTRRLYQARKYRLWSTLDVLITSGYCPLTMDELNTWRHYNKEEAKKNNNAGRIYPTKNAAFNAWIQLDFDADGLPDYSSPYQLRKELAETKMDFTQAPDRYKLGRALYHIAQRRGFKSSRKGADDAKEGTDSSNNELDLQYSEKKKNKVIAELFEKYPQAKTIGWLFALLEQNHYRIREQLAQHAIRENYKDEVKYIMQFQGLTPDHILYKSLIESGKNKNDGRIFYKRPLRSQKGLIGKCTLEPGKYRAPISHPEFERFRAWSFLNNIKYKKDDLWLPLPLVLKQLIYDELFFRKSKSYFPFSDIQNLLIKKGFTADFNYSNKTTVTACPVSARLKEIHGDDFLNVRVPKAAHTGNGKSYYDIHDLWHILFNFEDQEYVAEFAETKLKLNTEQVKQFIAAWNNCPVGYGMLSLHAIKKINRFLLKGFIYTEAVLMAKLPDLLGKERWEDNEQLFINNVGDVLLENRHQKQLLQIVNGLIASYKNTEVHQRQGYRNADYKLDQDDLNAIHSAIQDYYGIKTWNSFSPEKQKSIFMPVKDCYQGYFSSQGILRDEGRAERLVTIHSGNTKYYKTESGYFQVPKLIDTLKEFLRDHFEDLSDDKLSKIYHPSDISIYPPASEVNGTLILGSPKTGSFKNPMAMRTLHELRKLMNYLIESHQINNETRVVVEVARELNDANKRWAIEAWQRQREAENQEFASAISQLLQEYSGIKANASSNDDIDKMRLFFEQHTEQTLPEVTLDFEGEQGKKKKKKAIEKDDIVRWSGHGKKLIDKYRFWKEQGYQCIYTGKFIKLTDLFNENIIDFEHTIPRSKSFDNSLANLTVCYHDYNRTVKKNRIPVQLENYNRSYDFGGSIGLCTAIQPRLEPWLERVKRIKQQIEFWKSKSKRAADKSWKDDAIRQRHLWQMELDYWQNKIDRFQIKEITSGFKNSQKVDTQLISKYAFHYLKTYFEKVDVQKGSITAEFRKIYHLQAADEAKDRSKHSHHAKDAAVLTLIPVAARRDSILEHYYEARENGASFVADPPFKGFKREFITGIDEVVLINNIARGQELTPAKRKIRKRGKEVFIKNPDGTLVNKWATGDCIRGQLHQDTFYGAIKPAKRGEFGNLLKDEHGKFIQEEDIRYVQRIPFNADFDKVDKIVDEGLKKQITDHIKRLGSFKAAYEQGIYLLDKSGNRHGNKIRHIRVWANVSEPLAIKKQTNLSSKEYKQNYWAANATNSYFAIYKGAGKTDYDFRNLFDVAKMLSNESLRDPKDFFESSITIQRGKTQTVLPLKYILKVGLKVIFKKDEDEEIIELNRDDLSKRIYVLTRFEKDSRLNFQYHLEARNKIDKNYLESEVDFSNPKPTLRFSYSKYTFLVEGYDFEVKRDGTIVWK